MYKTHSFNVYKLRYPHIYFLLLDLLFVSFRCYSVLVCVAVQHFWMHFLRFFSHSLLTIFVWLFFDLFHFVSVIVPCFFLLCEILPYFLFIFHTGILMPFQNCIAVFVNIIIFVVHVNWIQPLIFKNWENKQFYMHIQIYRDCKRLFPIRLKDIILKLSNCFE